MTEQEKLIQREKILQEMEESEIRLEKMEKRTFIILNAALIINLITAILLITKIARKLSR